MSILEYMKEKELMNRLKFFILMISLIVVDQITKILIVANKGKLPCTIFNGILDFTYCENRGIAFGFASGHVQFFSIFTIIILIAIVFMAYKNFSKIKGLCAWGVAFMLAGGFGNFIDRAFRTYVVDFIDFGNLFDFPIFNFADICVVCGVIAIGIGLLISYRREEIEGNNS